jgi:hypothetical protein
VTLRELLKKKIQFLSLIKLKCDGTIAALKDNKNISLVDKLQLLNVECEVAARLPIDKDSDLIVKNLIKKCEDLGFEFFKPLHLIVTICASLDAATLKAHRPSVQLLTDILTLQAEYETIYQLEAIEFLYTKMFIDFSSRFEKLSREIARLPFVQHEDYKNLYKAKEKNSIVNAKPVTDEKPQSKSMFSLFSSKADEKNDNSADRKTKPNIRISDDEFNSAFALVELMTRCEQYKKYNIKKMTDHPEKKSRATKKIEMLNKLIGKLEITREKAPKKISLFMEYYADYRLPLMAPTRMVGLSEGEKFAKNIDNILEPFLKAKKALKK